MLNNNFIIIGDPHYKTNNSSYTDELENAVLKQVESNNKTDVVILGDILHNHDKIDLYPMLRFYKFIEKLKSSISGIIFLIIGNHDRPTNKIFCEKNVHPFVGWEVENKVVIVDVPMEFEKYLFVPYVEDGRFYESIKDFDLKKIKIVFCHQTLNNPKIEKYEISHPFCISGHIHEYNLFQKNLLYVGSPQNNKTIFTLKIKENGKLSLVKHKYGEIKPKKEINQVKSDHNFRISPIKIIEAKSFNDFLISKINNDVSLGSEDKDYFINLIKSDEKNEISKNDLK